eukprot:TRINITY_DN4613_c0_g1_i2.p3 TRINITY_DN4613_c0_g1~~TRINITY_DN4613_c0_g1_i2.p3  ORF type:complete len:131 (-),score=22.96 TRINITY_DN4613_c0_g1_i2:19-411(-)
MSPSRRKGGWAGSEVLADCETGVRSWGSEIGGRGERAGAGVELEEDVEDSNDDEDEVEEEEDGAVEAEEDKNEEDGVEDGNDDDDEEDEEESACVGAGEGVEYNWECEFGDSSVGDRGDTGERGAPCTLR